MSNPSQNASLPAASARQPKRERGRQRVDALLQAAAEVLAAKGFDGATMTEIAARAGASIGSLYQFFPNKTLLVQALRDHFVEHALTVFSRLEVLAPSYTTDQLADALIAYIREVQVERAASQVITDMRNEHDPERVRARGILTAALGRVLCAANPRLTPARAAHCARLILYLLRLVVELPQEPDGASFGQELRTLLHLYLENLNT
jgi:AcrR family transcriptional regulator